ncbi:MAG: fibronectin type III domain-containing protein [Thermonemataceae bacterium]
MQINLLSLKIVALSVGLLLSSQLTAQKQRTYTAPDFAENWSKPSTHPDHIVLNFGEDPATQMAVSWRTDTSIAKGYAEIALATAAPRFWRKATTYEATTTRMDASNVKTAEIISHYHTLLFEDLLPDTLYAYRVGDGKIWSEWIQFRTASKQAKPFSFLYVGDAQNYILELWSRLIREGYRKAPEASFIIHAGDLVSDAHSERQWHEWFIAGGWIHSMLPSIPVVGNHEYEPYNDKEEEKDIEHLSIQWKPQFNLPKNGPKGHEETIYYIDYQDLRVIVLNTKEDRKVQVPWLEETLKNNPKKWTVVTYHHPMFSASAGRDNKNLREYWKPLFDKYKVDLALQGHDHSYARGRVAPAGENIVDGLNRLDETGTVYVVSVSGGKMYRLKESWEEYKEAKRDRAAENTQLFQVINIDGDTLTFTSYTAVGELYDKFMLIKQANGKPNKFIEMNQQAVEARRHDNTISYQDFIPDAYLEMVKNKYKGFEVDGIRYLYTADFEGYQIKLESKELEILLTLDAAGKIIKEEREED